MTNERATATAEGENIGRNSAIMAIGTMGSRVLGFARGALFTAAVGGALAADAFTLGNTLPTTVYVLINGGLLSAVLIPQLTKAMARRDGGQDFTDRLLTLAILTLALVTIVSFALTPWLINLLSSNKDPQFLALTTTFAYFCIPQIFFYGLYSILGQVLNVHGRFAAYAWAPAWANIIQIAGLAYFVVQWGKQPTVNTWTSQMIWVLAGTTTLGIAVQGLGLLIPLRATGFRFRPRFGWRGYGFGEVSRMALWTMAALVLTQVGALVTTRALTVGASKMENVAGNAVQQFAYTLFILPHSLVTISVITALFPAMSRAYNSGSVEALRHLVVRGLTVPAVLVIPASVALIALARPISATVYPGLRYLPEEGIDEPSSVALVLALMAIGIFPLGITALKQRYCFARSDGWFNFWTVAVMTAGNLLTAWIAAAYTPPQYVVAVIGLGASLSSIAAALCFLVVARSQLGGIDGRTVLSLWVRLTLTSAVAGLAGWWVAGLITGKASPWIMQVVGGGTGGVVFILAFVVLARVARIEEVTEILQRVTGRLRRGAPS